MTKDEALKLALEALENASNIMDSWAQKRQDDAITAIKEALAQHTWVGLTDHEKNKMAFVAGSDKYWLINLVENKLKEKNT